MILAKKKKKERKRKEKKKKEPIKMAERKWGGRWVGVMMGMGKNREAEVQKADNK